MVDISFLEHYRRALYPLNLNDGPSPLLSSRCGVMIFHGARPPGSLLDLASAKIVQDSSTTRAAIEIVPKELMLPLMRAALNCSKDRSVEVLLSRWPWRVLSLSAMVPAIFDSVAVLYDDSYVTEHMRRGVKYTTCLAHTFVECLKTRMPTNLRCLDLAGYPVAEVIVNYLSSHVLLVYNEARQRDIITLYNEVTQHLPEEQKQRYELEATFPDGTYVVIVDGFLQTADTHMELCRALKTSTADQSRLKLCVSKLDLTCLGVPRISVLLENVRPEFLTGLCLQYNTLSNEGMVILAPVFSQLKMLNALDLSCNKINATSNQQTCDLLAQSLSALPHLRRLDLSNNRTKYRLRQILSGVPRPLEYLRLCASGLGHVDLLYLRSSHHASALRELDISENVLRESGPTVCSLLGALSETLKLLEMEDCDFVLADLLSISETIRCLSNLVYLSLYRNPEISSPVLEECYLPALVSMDNLAVAKFSYPPECYRGLDDERQVREDKAEIVQRLAALAANRCAEVKRLPMKFVLAN